MVAEVIRIDRPSGLAIAPTPARQRAGSVVEVDGDLLPGSAPRFSTHPVTTPVAPPGPGRDTSEVLAAVGLDVDALVTAGVAVEA